MQRKNPEIRIKNTLISHILYQILNSCTDVINEPARCGESSAVGGFPAVGDW
ncbi:MAG: hypothetical protein V7K35_11160 [Nostoc sp.]